MKIEVKFGPKVGNFELADTATLADLKKAISDEFGIAPPLQKLLGKPALQKEGSDSKPLAELGFSTTSVSKLMLIGTTVKEVAQANVETTTKAVERVKRIKDLGDYFWKIATFGGCMCDSLVAGAGRPAEGASAAEALMIFDAVLSRINVVGGNSKLLRAVGRDAAAEVSHALLPELTLHQREAICDAHMVLRSASELAAKWSAVTTAEGVPEIIDSVITLLSKSAVNEWILIPSGVIGQRDHLILMLLLCRTSKDQFSLVIVNRESRGSETYHAVHPTATKLKTQSCLRMDRIQQDRLLDPSFWLMLLSLSLRANDPQNTSEYCRPEMLYDCLLPWLGERDPATQTIRDFSDVALTRPFMLPPDLSAAAEEDNASRDGEMTADEQLAFTTATRSESTAAKSTMTAFCFLLQVSLVERAAKATQRISAAELLRFVKSVKFALKYEFLVRAGEDVVAIAKRFLEGSRAPMIAEGSPSPATASSPSWQRLLKTAVPRNLASLSTAEDVKRLEDRVADAVAAGVDSAASAVTLQTIISALTPQDFWKNSSNKVVPNPSESVRGKFTLCYFSASWCGPCKRVGPLLRDCVDRIEKRLGGRDVAGAALEVVLISCDKTSEDYEAYVKTFPTFSRLSWPASAVFDAVDIKGIPTLMVFAPDGSLLTAKGVDALRKDPEGVEFPFGRWSGCDPLSETDLVLLRGACQTLAHATLKRHETSQLSHALVQRSHAVIRSVSALVDTLPSASADENIDETQQQRARNAANPSVPSAVFVTPTVASSDASASFVHGDLLPKVSKAAYYGSTFKPTMPNLGDASVFAPVTSMNGLLVCLGNARVYVECLWQRARNSGTSSRVAVQMQIVEFISWLFSEVIPVPAVPASAATAGDNVPWVVSSLFDEPFPEHGGEFLRLPGMPADRLREIGQRNMSTTDAQMFALQQLYFLTLSYGTAWQAVETPTRAHDSERCIVSMHLLMTYQSLLRNSQNAHDAFMLSFLLTNDDGGYYFSTTLCRNTRTFEDVSSALELTNPKFACIRDALIVLIRHQQTQYRREIFDLRQTDKLELRKHSYTVDFLRRFLENCGYEVFSRDPMARNMSEMEKLMSWLCDHRAPVAREHPEFPMTRDMVLLAKFLATMESRDAQLLRKKKDLDEFASWRLSFEEDTPGRQMSAGWRTRPDPPRWECVMVRGRDMDIADLSVKGFGDRELSYGDGIALHSPIDVASILEIENPTEDDILHAKSLPTLGDTLTIEEAEYMWSTLTVPYLRIPLLLDFFSNHDRHSYLFTQGAQDVLRSAIFEPGRYLSRGDLMTTGEPLEVPMRLTSQQRTELQLAQIRGDRSKKDCMHLLGTHRGLLFQELCMSHVAVFRPLMRLIDTITELGKSSVYSLNSAYVLYLLSLVTDVCQYALFIVKHVPCASSAPDSATRSDLLQDAAALRATVAQTLDRVETVIIRPFIVSWKAEAEGNDDIPTRCVVESYHAQFLDVISVAVGLEEGTSPTRQSEYTRSLLASCAFVRSRHGFGMGMQRTQLVAAAGDALLTPEEKLLRFLQAQGLDTTHVTQEMLDHGQQMMMSGGKRRAIFVQIRSRTYNDTVRVPNLFRATNADSTSEAKSRKLPPVDVPEQLVFRVTMRRFMSHRDWMAQLCASSSSSSTSSSTALDDVMHYIVSSVLREDENSGNHNSASSPSLSTDRWRVKPGANHDVFVSESTGFTFHLQSCELFWRNDELKPVPDSMSHFADYETILGKDVLQCGLVQRTEHRHWVHVVGTAYDLMEWSEPDEKDRGVHQPRILMGPPHSEAIERVAYEGRIFDRLIDVDDVDPWPVKRERWAIELIRTVFKQAFKMPKEIKFSLLAEASAATATATAAAAEGDDDASAAEPFRVILNDGAQYEGEENRNTWKEVLVYKHPRQLLIFNLVPHARSHFRSLVFASNQALALHSLPLHKSAKHPDTYASLRNEAGELKKRVQNETSLEIWRFNASIRGREVYRPARLLQGVIPSCLLESFLFWHGEDDVLRGYPMADDDDDDNDNGGTEKDAERNRSRKASLQSWFNYAIEATFTGQRVHIRRLNHKRFTPIRHRTDAAAVNLLGNRSGSFDSFGENANATLKVPANTVAMLRDIFPPLSYEVLEHALRTCRLSVTDAIDWVSSPENAGMISSMMEAFNEKEKQQQEEEQHQSVSDAALVVDSTTGTGGTAALARRRRSHHHSSPARGNGGGSPTRSSPRGMTRSHSFSQDSDGGMEHRLSSQMLLEAGVDSTEDEEPQELTLLDITHCCHTMPLVSPNASVSMGFLSSCLRSVEDASHILTWAVKDVAAGDDSESFRVHMVELPRLRAKLQPKLVDSDEAGFGQQGASSWRLFLLDHPGWMIANPPEYESDPRLVQLIQTFPQHLVMRNMNHEFAVFVPNHDFSRQEILGNPFARSLLFDRSSMQWQESVSIPFYLYPVHTSRALLLPPSLGATLYMSALFSIQGLYESALRSLESCYVDTAFTVEEAFMCSMMERTVDRSHPDLQPDAHAVRLKLLHAIMYSENRVNMDAAVELLGYLTKLPHVTSACRLNRDEVLDLIKRCERAPAVVKAQLQLWVPFLQLHQVVIPVGAQEHMLRMGQPFDKLQTMPWEVLSSTSTKLRRIQFRHPAAASPQSGGVLRGKAAVELVWNDDVLVDEESGTNRQLGFYFLYLMRKGRIPVMLSAADDEGAPAAAAQSSSSSPLRRNLSTSLAQLLIRAFHLRHSRWGKEATQSGESDATPSYALAVLAAVDTFPDAAWPEINDRAILNALQKGLNIPSSSEEAERGNTTRLLQFSRGIDSTMRTLYQGSYQNLQRLKREIASRHRLATEKKVRVRMFDFVVPRVTPHDTAAESISISMASSAAAAHFSSWPLNVTKAIDDFIVSSTSASHDDEEKEHHQQQQRDHHRPPFDFDVVKDHPIARTHIAQDMLRRMMEDSRTFDTMTRNAATYALRGLTPEIWEQLGAVDAEHTAEALAQELSTVKGNLSALRQRLRDMLQQDAAAIVSNAQRALVLANNMHSRKGKDSSTTATPTRQEVALFELERASRDRSPLTLDWLLGALMSSRLTSDVAKANPFHGDIDELRSELALLMLHSHRVAFSLQCIVSISALESYVSQVVQPFVVMRGQITTSPPAAPAAAALNLDVLRQNCVEWNAAALVDGEAAVTAEIRRAIIGRLKQLATAAVDLLTAKRYYATATPSALLLDPRFLLFEFLFTILLRKRQVEMVRWFVANIREGRSRVQQMLMGQGKTTVVGPLLALILADGDHLVTQVMPTALLEQSRVVLRKCFTVLVPKRILSLSFDRSCDDDPDAVEALYQKLECAKRMRAVVVAPPECVKALFLKYIEELHTIETVPTADLVSSATGDERSAKEAQLLRKRTIAKSNMSDALEPILRLWQEGVLLMDEVDVLLHPLRSELNFPIGLKEPIELSGPRWYLPMHLLKALFPKLTASSYRHSAATSSGASFLDGLPLSPEATIRDDMMNAMQRVLASLDAALDRGVAQKALQREPHLVLLDHEYYISELQPLFLQWAAMWLFADFASEAALAQRRGDYVSVHTFCKWPNSTRKSSGDDEEGANEEAVTGLQMSVPDFMKRFVACVAPFICAPNTHALLELRDAMHRSFSARQMQLLFLTRDWLQTLLPHVMAKINRVGFGLLQSGDLSRDSEEHCPLSRILMAVPFVAKDVPSRSSEFAHPDVLIGLTILAYRYEGLRLSDTRVLLQQLKHDHSSQTGPRERRPAAKLYASWLAAAAASLTPSDAENDEYVPLSQVHVQDLIQLHRLHNALKRVPDVLYYYLSHHIFPATMNFQSMKISACGHELGSSMIFHRRIGFSGTPSNLLPLDLGECFYEPGSDGNMLSALTDTNVTSCELLPDSWNPGSVLRHIAEANPPYHALIDTGALITNMDNQQAARCLLQHLPPHIFEGVVFLDKSDRQMILLRSNEAVVPLSQCGIAPSRRFTFFDQVHTTGMDIKQAPTAIAAVTLGKDLVFRDYAQGAYRMRGIGRGQTIRVLIIPEVHSRIHDVLYGSQTATPTKMAAPHQLVRDVPAWLILNAMRFEGLQHMKLCQQELDNVWRKRALEVLRRDVAHHQQQRQKSTSSHTTEFQRCRRFCAASASLLRHAIAVFREDILFPVPSSIEASESLVDRVQRHMNRFDPQLLSVAVREPATTAAIETDDGCAHHAHQLIDYVLRQISASTTSASPASDEGAHAAIGLNAEVVHEQEAEEEQEQEAEQEEQRVSRFARDDEQHIPWRREILTDPAKFTLDATERPQFGSPFYQVNRLTIGGSQRESANDAWRLNVPESFVLSDNFFRWKFLGIGERRMKHGFLYVVLQIPPHPSDGPTSSSSSSGATGAALVSLAEGESLRWLMHHSKSFNDATVLDLRMVGSADRVDATNAMRKFQREEDVASNASGYAMDASILYRFLDNEMFFDDVELARLERVLKETTHDARLHVFLDCLRCRRRQRNEWEDAPVAALFTNDDDTLSPQHAAGVAKLMRGVLAALRRTAVSKKLRDGSAVDPRTDVQARLSSYLSGSCNNSSPMPLTEVAQAILAVLNAGNTAQQRAQLQRRHKLTASTTSATTPATATAGAKMFHVLEVQSALFHAARGMTLPSPSAAGSVANVNEERASSAHITWAEVVVCFPELAAPGEVWACRTCRGINHTDADERVDRVCRVCGHPDPRQHLDAIHQATVVGEPQLSDWDCQVCTLRNAPHIPLCLACSTPNPNPPAAEGAPGLGQAAAEWSCGSCTLWNASSAATCAVCGAANPNPPSNQSTASAALWDCPEGHWACAVEQGGCSKFNPNSAFYCQVCDRARPNLASLRF